MTALPSARRVRRDAGAVPRPEAPQAPAAPPAALDRTMHDVFADAVLMGADEAAMRAILDDVGRAFAGAGRGRLAE